MRAVIAFMVFAGCSLEDLADLTDTNITAKDTKLPEASDTLVSTMVAPDRVTYTFSGAPDVKLAAGNVIVGKESGGYLRHVTSTQTNGNTLVVMTSDAAVTDAIANVNVSVPIDPASTANVTGIPVVDLTGKVLIDTMVQGVPVKVTVTKGTLTLQPSFTVDLDIASQKLRRFGVTAKGTIALDLDVKLEVGGSATFMQETDLSGPTASLYTYPFVFLVPTPIGPLPVAGTLDVDAFAGFIAMVTARGTLTAGVEGQSSLQITAAWSDGQWSVDNTPGFMGMLHKPTASAIVASDARAYVRPELRVKLYGVIGPHASVTPALDAKVTAVPTPSVALQGCISGQVGVDAKIFGLTLGDLSHDFPEQCIPLPIQ